MGEVYRAHDTGLNRTIALKILPGKLAANEDRMRRFVQEAQAAAALNHPNIATTHEIGEAYRVRCVGLSTNILTNVEEAQKCPRPLQRSFFLLEV